MFGPPRLQAARNSTSLFYTANGGMRLGSQWGRGSRKLSALGCQLSAEPRGRRPLASEVYRRRRVRTLKVEETVAEVCARERAGVVAPQDAIPVVGNAAVSPVAKRARKPRQQAARETPEPAELAEDVANGVGARTQRFVRLPVVDEDVDRVEIGGIYAVPGEEAGGEGTL